MSTQRLMTTREVAARLGVTPRQVARMTPSRIKPAYSLPGVRGAHMFDPNDVERLEAERASSNVPHPTRRDRDALSTEHAA